MRLAAKTAPVVACTRRFLNGRSAFAIASRVQDRVGVHAQIDVGIPCPPEPGREPGPLAEVLGEDDDLVVHAGGLEGGAQRARDS